MKISPYGIMTLVILAMSAPALVLAETENEANEGTNELTGKQSTTETEHEESDNKSMSSANWILFVTIAAIASVVGYSAWKVYKVRRRAASKTLV